MAHRTAIAVASLLSLLPASGCSGPGDVNAAPGARVAAQSLAAVPAPSSVRIREYSDLPRNPSSNYQPSSITLGPDGNLWVTDTIDQDVGANAVVSIATSGKPLHTYYYTGSLSPGSELYDIAVGPDGAFWMPDTLNAAIVRMTTQGTFTTYSLNYAVYPFNIVAGRDKALWFTGNGKSAGVIGRITVDGHVRTFNLRNQAGDIAAGPDGALWFTEYKANQIGRITTRGKVTEYSDGITAGPASISPGPDGALWFTEPSSGRIGRITTSGQVTEYSQGITPTERPQDIAAGPDGAMWFTEYELLSYQATASKIGRITMDGQISEYSKGMDPKSGPTAITSGTGDMWFVATFTDKTGRVRQ